MTPAVAIGGSLTGAVTLVAAQLSGGSLLVDADDVVALVLMGIVILPVALALMTQASRHLSTPEISLLALLETVLGPSGCGWFSGSSHDPPSFWPEAQS